MANTLFGFLLFSFTINAALIVPFINLLYKLKFQQPAKLNKDFLGKVNQRFNKHHQNKQGTPVGGGLLIIITTSFLFLITITALKLVGSIITSVYPMNKEITVIFATFVFYGLLGLYDDIVKFFDVGGPKIGLKMKEKLISQLALGSAIGWYLYSSLGISILNIPYFGVIELGFWYVPFAALVITGFSNAVNITDGLDGLSSGLLMIALFAITILASSILDTPTSLFLALWLGGIIAFLYFNTYPARIFLGDVGALSFGATLAVIGLLLGNIIAISVICGIFIIEISSSFIQIFGKKYLGRKLLPLSPAHLWLQDQGWDEPKIVTRAWLAGIILAIFGLWLAFL